MFLTNTIYFCKCDCITVDCCYCAMGISFCSGIIVNALNSRSTNSVKCPANNEMNSKVLSATYRNGQILFSSIITNCIRLLFISSNQVCVNTWRAVIAVRMASH